MSKAATKTARQTSKPESIRCRIKARIDAHPDVIESRRECDRLRVERATLQSKLDQATARLQDTDRMVAAIEAGQTVSVDAGESVEALKAQIEAFTLAVNRADSRHRDVLQSISREIAAEFAPEHRERVERMAMVLTNFRELADSLTEIPGIMQSFGINAPAQLFPAYHRADMQDVINRFGHFSNAYTLWLKEN
ncbi:MAG: hypothetical protein KDA79_02660 [Planctomycetaceae bacterium]|nr:hypothetical protein [Planctomycetaceae bacterium]